MALQNYTPIRLPPTLDPLLRHELLKVDIFLRQLTPFAARVPTFPQGTPASALDLTQFLFLPGRSPRQRAFGNVTFSAGSIDQGTALDDSVLRGFVLEGNEIVSGFPVTHSVYFQPDGDANVTIVRKWIFPSISGSVTDTFTFAATTGAQTFVGKTITSGILFVGTNATSNTFRSTTNGTTQEFTISPNTGFPTTASVQTKPTLRLPGLDISVPTTDRHTFMMLHSSTTAPFTIGSIAHGNHDGTEMEMLPASTTNGRVLRWNNGETIASCTWTTGTTTIFGAFTTANTRPGMRVRGDSGLSIYVDEFTRIVTVMNGVSVTVDTPLVGNSVGTTCQTWGPTWDFELSGVDHGSLTGLTDDDHLQYLYLQGRAGGQVIGNTAHTGGNITDIVLEGRLLLGDGLSGINFTDGRPLDIRSSLANNTAHFNIIPTASTPTGAASGTINIISIQPASVGYTSGSYQFNAFRFLSTATLAPSGVTVTVVTAMNLQNTPSEGGDPGSGGTFGVINTYRGGTILNQGASNASGRAISIGTTNTSTAITSAGLFVAPIIPGLLVNAAGVPSQTTLASITDASNAVLSQAATATATVTADFRPIGTEITGLRIAVSGRAKPVTSLYGIDMVDAGSGSVYATTAAIFNAAPLFNTAGITTWSLLKLDTTVSNPTTVWLFNLTAVNNSRHAGNFSIGSTATPTAKVHLGAGTTAASSAPLKFTSGTNMTTAEAGAMEWDGSRAYLTQTVGPTRKTVAYTDDSLPSVPGFSRIFATMGA